MTDGDDKYLPAARLVELLSRVPPDTRVLANKVGNLLLEKPNGGYLGYIDMRYGTVEFK